MSGAAFETADFLGEAIIDRLPYRSRTGRSGFTNFDCPVCTDKRQRCGVLRQSGGGVVINCFNCGFKSGWSPGRGLAQNLRDFLSALGLPDDEIALLAFRAAQLRGAMLDTPGLRERVPHFAAPSFDTVLLPVGSRSFSSLLQEGCVDPDFLEAVAYVAIRGSDVSENFEFYWTPTREHGMNRRVLIPCTCQGLTVGWTARSIDADMQPRYRSAMPSNLLFNSGALSDRKRGLVILVEGVFDAIAIDSVGLMGARLNRVQIDWIRSYRKKTILVPDYDQRGLEMIDVALREGWHVAFPWGEFWDWDVKDVAQATQLYGRLWTLTSILHTATDSPARIAANRQRLHSFLEG